MTCCPEYDVLEFVFVGFILKGPSAVYKQPLALI